MSATLASGPAPVAPRPDTGRPLLDVRDLTLAFRGKGAQPTPVVRGVGLRVAPGKVVAVVGESGSGKTLLARSILGLLPPSARVASGRIEFEGRDLLSLPEHELRRVRGARIGMVFQEPMVSLNPALRIGFQMCEAMRLHTDLAPEEIRERAVAMLRRVRIGEPEACLARYPHQFSGGMRQRIMLASVLMPRPSLLLADEPTTALDSIVQKEVLDITLEVTRDLGTSVVLITHDLGLVAAYADRVTVMRKGEVLEEGPTNEVLFAPRHEYTRALLEALPRRPERRAGEDAVGPGPRTLVDVRDLRVNFSSRRSWPWQTRRVTRAVAGIDLQVRRGEVVAVVGESGSGKTTLGRAILRLVPPDGGSVAFDGEDLTAVRGARLRRLRPKMQLVFQDPCSALDPRMRVEAVVAEGLRHKPGLAAGERRQRVRAMLAEVRLGPDYLDRFPHELSGGERQRVCIARALIGEPQFVVADEPMASLDVTIQAQVLLLLQELQRRHGFSCLLITHNLGVVEQIADRVAVMCHGRIVELGSREALFDDPRHPYTQQLLAAVTELATTSNAGFRLRRRTPRPVAAPPGWVYEAADSVADERAPLVAVGPDHYVACRRPDPGE